MTVRPCGLLHELFNSGSKVHVKKFVCLLPALLNVVRARLCCSRISNCEGLFSDTVVIITCFIFCMLFIVWNNNSCLSDIWELISWAWKDSCTGVPHGDLCFWARPPKRLAALFVGVRACGLPPSALSLLGNFNPAGSDKCCILSQAEISIAFAISTFITARQTGKWRQLCGPRSSLGSMSLGDILQLWLVTKP